MEGVERPNQVHATLEEARHLETATVYMIYYLQATHSVPQEDSIVRLGQRWSMPRSHHIGRYCQGRDVLSTGNQYHGTAL
ncbi:hypothetical protein JX266_001435 [Neoarthrinium moseri]|uniref:uncharacterized protein n=1 Tax=Neoarthrinium moseri TaxID=1658444 RepID=UPI001FDE614F|nr:uncharacterized protein JN550_001549 [Neoarthrinium moseri]KAI1854294.1 hypothetical protein JX266_001435 [Neoarthrinium moseri]KAI1876053.1 hypothetical protein JN550_001549 [Neoarthrinium moseri]